VCIQPSGSTSSGGADLVLVVAAGDVPALHQDLAVVGDADLHARDGRATVPMRMSPGGFTVVTPQFSVWP